MDEIPGAPPPDPDGAARGEDDRAAGGKDDRAARRDAGPGPEGGGAPRQGDGVSPEEDRIPARDDPAAGGQDDRAGGGDGGGARRRVGTPDRGGGPVDRAGVRGRERRLGADLRALGRALDVPPAPDLRAGVRARLASPGPAGRAPAGLAAGQRWGRAAAVLVALAVLAGGTLAVSPRARAAVADFFRFGPIRVHSGAPPTPVPSSTPAATPRFGGLLPDSRFSTLADARRDAAFPVGVPAALGRPDQVLARAGARPEFVALRYGPRPGLPAVDAYGLAAELDEFAGTMTPYLDKYLLDSPAQLVRVGADQGIWIDGPHEVVFADRTGAPRFDSARLAARTLLWQHGHVTLRLEGDFTREQALAIAASLR